MKNTHPSDYATEFYVALHEAVVGGFLVHGGIDGPLTEVASEVLIRMGMAYQDFRKERKLD